MPWKFGDDISNGSGVMALTDRQTNKQTDRHYWEHYHPHCASGKMCKLKYFVSWMHDIGGLGWAASSWLRHWHGSKRGVCWLNSVCVSVCLSVRLPVDLVRRLSISLSHSSTSPLIGSCIYHLSHNRVPSDLRLCPGSSQLHGNLSSVQNPESNRCTDVTYIT